MASSRGKKINLSRRNFLPIQNCISDLLKTSGQHVSPGGGNDCFIKNLKIWNKDLNIKQVLADSGIEVKNMSNKICYLLKGP